MSDRILVVEDEAIVAEVVERFLRREGYETMIVGDGREALSALGAFIPDLIVLDVMLPEIDGLEVCRQVRSRGETPIIMLTARGEETDKVLGLGLGADDYVTKPFGFLELMARAEALLRRAAGHGATSDRFEFGDVRVDFLKAEAHKGDREIGLSARELHLLRYFIRHPGEAISRERLLDAVWGYEKAPVTRTVDMHVAKLRKKIEDDPQNPCYILTVHRIGYKFTGGRGTSAPRS